MSNRSSPQLQFPEVVVVEASAGSGKTYDLAKRYLQLLINPNLTKGQIPLRNILAITFTNKATIEMKERILELLKKCALDAFQSQKERREILGLLGVEGKHAQEKASLIIDEITRHYNFFQIKTIDSFINALLLGCAFNIDRSAHFKIRRDYSQYLAYCLDKVIEESSTDPGVYEFLENFLEHYLFVENRSSWFPKKDILALMESLFSLSNQHGGAFGIHRGTSSEVIKKKTFLFNAVKEFVSFLPKGFNGTAYNAILKFVEAQEPTFELKAFPDRFSLRRPPMNKGKLAPGECLSRWRRIHEGIRKLCELDATVFYNPYVKLFQRMLHFFESTTKHEDLLFLSELNHKARLLFAQSGITVAELYYRLATRFTHYLIDEFQDTSVLQWRNLEVMIEDALSSGGSLFYVGDKKQAIYRFRGGEAELFDWVKEELAHYNVKERILQKNWRSQKAIVEFNNLLFSQKNLKEALGQMGVRKVMGKTDAIERIVQVFESSKQDFQPMNTYGYVHTEYVDEQNQEERNKLVKEKLLPLIAELSRRFLYKDIAILCRDNDEVELVTSWLLEAKIPVESEKTLNIQENPLIKSIVSFLRFLYSPIDDLSFASFILGEVFRGTTGLSFTDITDFLFRVNKKKTKDGRLSLYRHFRKTFPLLWEDYFDQFFKSTGFTSPYELLVSIYDRFKVIKNFADDQAFFMKFLEFVKEKEDEYVGLGELLFCLDNAQKEDLYVRVTETDSVHILTIHKSKGLEFGVVITPFLRMDISPETGGRSSSSYATALPDQQLRLVRITKEHLKYSQRLVDIYREAYARACVDELNNLYVALTRPKYELYILLPRKSGVGFNKARYLFPDAVVQYGSKRTYASRQERERPIFQIPPCDYQDWVQFLKDEFADAEMIRNRENILEGSILHAILSRIENCAHKDIDAQVTAAVEHTKTHYPFCKNFVSYEQKIKALLKRKDFENIFLVYDGQVFCEKEVVNKLGQTKRIDRLIARQKEVWIVDYKSSQQNKQACYAQIREYSQIMKEMYPARNIKGILVYLDTMTQEQVLPKEHIGSHT
ncbi:MAG: UvrD-helicase domain-containing protein [Candidatus Omnitrophota bacterium]|nr:MAG: UvrD-helicase domain-containing protein [Candidatus Omnitrophota bacterium]